MSMPTGWSVARFMEEALYHPERGYYARNIRDVGARGDFATTATMHPALASAITSWACAASRQLKHPGPRHWIEIGGGNGALAAGIQKRLGWLRRSRVRYHIVEISEALREKQQFLLKNTKIQSHSTLQDALTASGGHAILFSNELADAFPVNVYMKDGESWRELLVHFSEGNWKEEAGLPPRETSSALAALAQFPQGQRVEVAFPYRDWLRDWAPLWKSGRMLTIDYGESVETLYHRRPRGTLRGYFHHQRMEGEEIYRRMGWQDLTTDVNFTDLTAWGAELGWKTVRFENQREFLLRQSPSLKKRANKNAVLGFLLSEEGAGGRFRVLEQEPGLTSPDLT